MGLDESMKQPAVNLLNASEKSAVAGRSKKSRASSRMNTLPCRAGNVQERSRLSRLVRMASARLPEHRSHHQCRNQHTDPEQTGVPEMRGCVDGLCAQCFAEPVGENWPDRRGDAERQEID